jgi:sialic acid synthase SpsE
MSSLWDAGAVAALDPLIAVHKVGSGDFTNLPLLEVLLATNKPIILSTAMATLDEVRSVVQFISEKSPSLLAHGNLSLLHCVAMSGDPLDRFANLGAIRTLQREFPEIPIGYSDHTVGMRACEIASAMGACVIEKHFTDDKTRAFRDHQISGTVEDFVGFQSYLHALETLMGTGDKVPVPGIETPERIGEFRRAVYLASDCKEGQIVTKEQLTTLRPNVGIDAREFYRIIGKRLVRDVKAFHRLSWEDFA